MKNFFKGIVVGLGGVAPGLSGSVLMVIFGLYQKTISCVSSILNFKKLKENLTFLIPLGLGMVLGVILFSNAVNFLLSEFETDPAQLWQTDIFGKPLSQLVREGLSGKLARMPDTTQEKMREALEKIINEGNGGMICILL